MLLRLRTVSIVKLGPNSVNVSGRQVCWDVPHATLWLNGAPCCTDSLAAEKTAPDGSFQ